ncbi:MAG: hypothetical protein RLP44_04825 [Aggregatilineales bacterium]
MGAEITLVEVLAVASGLLGLFGLSFIILFIPVKSCADNSTHEEELVPETIIVDKHGYFSRHDNDPTA